MVTFWGTGIRTSTYEFWVDTIQPITSGVKVEQISRMPYASVEQISMISERPVEEYPSDSIGAWGGILWECELLTTTAADLEVSQRDMVQGA